MNRNESGRKALGPLSRRMARLALPLLLGALAACGGDSSTPAPPPSEGSATLGAAGGTVAGPDGTSLSIPAGALDADATFRIARDSRGAPALVGITTLSPIYAVTPHGTAFATDALMALPYNAALAPAGTLPVVLRGEPDGTWHVQPLVASAPGVASIDVAGLSWYAIGVCTPGDAGVFGFGIGDCPTNSQLKLEVLDGSGVAIPVARDALGRALPFLPEITAPTDVVVRASWTRPAGVDRVDSIVVSASNLGTLLARDVNQASFAQDIVVHFDPHSVAGAGGANGIVQRVRADTSYCFHGFIIGRGDNQTVCWSFDTDIAFRLHDLGTPGAPAIATQPQPVSVTAGQPATFTVAASAAGTLTIAWQRSNDGGATWSATGTTTPGLTLATTTLADNNALFRAHLCDVVGAQQSCVDSAAAPLTVLAANVAPVFVTQPADASIVEGQTASITVSASGAPAPRLRIYQVGTILDSLVRECPAPGTGSSASCSYATAALAASQSSLQFYAVADNVAGSARSSTATVTVTSAAAVPVITLQPVATSTAVGGSASFTVTATGTAPLSYQWQFNGNPVADATAGASSSGIAGSQSSLLTISNAQTADDGDYRVVVSNGAGPAYSLSAHLTVTGGVDVAPAFTQAPANQTLVEGGGATLTVAASGSPAPDIVWFFLFGGVYTPLPLAPGGPVAVGACAATAAYGATTATLKLTAVSIGCDGGGVVAKAVNRAGDALSTPATLSVQANAVSLAGACFGDPSGWCYLQPAPVADPLTGLVVDAAAGKLVALGQVNGTVMTSTDNGNSWSVSWNAARYNWSSVAQPASGILVATGNLPSQGQSIFRSVDGGATWTTAFDGGCCEAIGAVAFADANVGVAVGSKVWRTVDGGATWAQVSIPLATLPAIGGLYRLAYAGNNVFVATAGTGTFLRSADGGLTWSRITTAGTDFLVDLAFGGTGFGVAQQQSQSQVLRTTDYGATWTVVNVTLSGGGGTVAFADANTVVVIGQYSAFIRSTDGGATWTDPDYDMAGGQNNWRAQFANASLGFAVGQYGAVARTFDGGQTWTRIAGGRLDDTIQQIEEAPGGGVTLATNLRDQVRRSTDAGATWSDGQATSFNGPAAISFGNASTVMAASLFGTVAISTDAGGSFTSVVDDSTVNFNTVAMASATTAIVAGRTSGSTSPDLGGFMRRTTDAGATWSPVTLPTTRWLWAARFLTPQVGLAGGQGGALLRTADGGATWSAIDLQPASVNDTVQFIARVTDTVAIVSTDSEIKRSTDGGLTWTRVYLNNGGSMRGVAFRDASNGIAVGYELLRTADGGQTWTPIAIPVGNFISGVAWAGSTTPVIGGDGGSLLRNQRSGALGLRQGRPLAVRAVPTQGSLAKAPLRGRAAGAPVKRGAATAAATTRRP